MDRYEAELKKLAIDLIVMAGENDPERHIAKWLESFRHDIRKHDADVCLYAAKEWRKDPMSGLDTDNRFRLQSAEACEQCAYRIYPTKDAR